jgi:uncharacterized protein YdaU (DUF1376 family)
MMRDSDRSGSAPWERLPFLPLFTGEFLSTTRGWSCSARGAYLELLTAQWDLGLLPRDPRRLRLLARATGAEWRSVWPIIEMMFPVRKGGRQNSALEAHRQKACRLREQRRVGAEKTNAQRRANTLSETLSARSAHTQGPAGRLASISNATEKEESTQKRKGLGNSAVVVETERAAR